MFLQYERANQKSLPSSASARLPTEGEPKLVRDLLKGLLRIVSSRSTALECILYDLAVRTTDTPLKSIGGKDLFPSN